MRKKVGHLGGRKLLASILKSGCAAVAMGLVVELLRRSHILLKAFGEGGERTYFDIGFLPLTAEVLALAVVGASVYFAVAWLLKTNELEQSWRLLARLVAKAFDRKSSNRRTEREISG